ELFAVWIFYRRNDASCPGEHDSAIRHCRIFRSVEQFIRAYFGFNNYVHADSRLYCSWIYEDDSPKPDRSKHDGWGIGMANLFKSSIAFISACNGYGCNFCRGNGLE